MAVSPTRLLVLGLIRMLQPVHGYDVRRELLSWRADEWAAVQPGSIYGALNTMERDGWIEVTETEQQARRPARTRYRVTAEGEQEFHTMLRSLWRSTDLPRNPSLPAIALLPFTSRDDVVTALRYRITTLSAEADVIRADIDRVLAGSGDPLTGVPHHVAEMSRLHLLHTEAELTWASGLLERIESGSLDVWSRDGLAAQGYPADSIDRVAARQQSGS